MADRMSGHDEPRLRDHVGEADLTADEMLLESVYGVSEGHGRELPGREASGTLDRKGAEPKYNSLDPRSDRRKNPTSVKPSKKK